MRWLHISDIHVGRPGPTSQQAALTHMVAAVDAAIGPEPVDAIFITGDIAYAGTQTQYDEFAKTTLKGLRSLASCAVAKILAVPGNHDVDCDRAIPIDWAHLGAQRQEQYFEESPKGQNLRASRALAFTDYAAFIANNGIESPNPLQEVTKLAVISVGGIDHYVVLTNTAFLCDKEFRDREQLPTPDLSLRSALQAVPADARILVLGHHPVYWFYQANRNPLRSLFLAHKALYIHGHTHEIGTEFGIEGLTEIGFGAAYQASSTASPTPYYRNTFAVCSLSADKLHVSPYNWDSENGRWVSTTTLPPGFQQRSPMVANAWAFPLAHGRAPAVLGAALSMNTKARALSVSPLGNLTSSDWSAFIVGSRFLPSDITEAMLLPQTAPVGRAYFEYTLPAGLHYVDCIGAPGSHLYRSHIEDVNTRLDTEGYKSYTLITFGTLDDDAETTYQRLRARKAIYVFAAADVASRLSALAPFQAELAQMQTAIADAEFVVAAGGKPLLLVEDKLKAAWFYVVESSGARLRESDAMVVALRQTRPELQAATYQSNLETEPGEGRPSFDAAAYLSACQAEFRAVKYAPLATVGLRLPGVTLEDLYVETGALPADEGAQISGERALDDFLQGAKVDGVVKEGITRLLAARSDAAISDRHEHSSARALYRHHGSVAVLGDPGSGKTCFVKREILEYCATTQESWYSKHIPIYIPLSEAAADDGSYELLSIAARLASRRGLQISELQIRELYSKGRLAIFLDGLDEVVSLEKRSKVLAAAKALIEEGRASGNRFVLTSRPAAIHRAELPRALHTIRMRGLTDEEMRALAERILAARVSETQGTLRLDVTQLGPSEQTTLAAFLEACSSTPGIDRLARNPLFLTLLMMIYINSGSASARRHRVYSQAVSTLVSIRAREAGQRVLSETDLRRRLGAVALGVFKDPQGAFPSYHQVVSQIKSVIDSERESAATEAEVERYIQDVAEATGILVLNRNDDGTIQSVGFMHHSFLEYYAAIGLSSTSYLEQLPQMARVPRWRDIISLLAGIVSDAGDATPIISALLSVRDGFENIVADALLLALDCVLEGDAPPERVLTSLIARINESITSGALANNSTLRREVGERLGRILQASNSPLLLEFFQTGLDTRDEKVCAAYVGVVGFVAGEVDLSKDVLDAFDRGASRAERVVQISVCVAIPESSQLRSQSVVECVRECLSGSMDARLAAVRAMILVPSVGKSFVGQLVRNLDDSSDELAELSARALMKIGISTENPEEVAWLATSLRRIAEGSSLDTAQEISLSYSRNTIESLLNSASKEQRMLGVRLLPWVHDSQQFVHDQLMACLNGGREETVAALASIRIAAGARMLLTVPDSHVLRGLLSKDYSRDVRLNAARTLATFGYGNPDISRDLVSFVKSIQGTESYADAVSLLAWSIHENEIAQAFLLQELERVLSTSGGLNKEQARELNSLLLAVAGMDTEANPRINGLLRMRVNDYKVDIQVRRRSLQALVAVSPIASGVKTLAALLRAAPGRLGYAVITATSRFLERCRRRLEYIATVFPDLEQLEAAVLDYHERAVATAADDAEALAEAARTALIDVRHMYFAYREFTVQERRITQSIATVTHI